MTKGFQICRNCPSANTCRSNAMCQDHNRPLQWMGRALRSEPKPPQRSYCLPLAAAKAATCNRAGHRFYYEENKPAQCPYCLVNEAFVMRESMRRARLHSQLINEMLEQPK